MFPNEVRSAIEQIHKAPGRMVYVFAGAGSQALWWLHSVAGSSNTIIAALDCYAARALADLLGAPPEQAVSPATAIAIARQAYRRAGELIDDGIYFGVGCTAAIATSRARRGADRAHVALCTGTAEQLWSLELDKGLERSKQEELVSRLVIRAIGRGCGLNVLVDEGRGTTDD